MQQYRSSTFIAITFFAAAIFLSQVTAQAQVNMGGPGGDGPDQCDEGEAQGQGNMHHNSQCGFGGSTEDWECPEGEITGGELTEWMCGCWNNSNCKAEMLLSENSSYCGDSGTPGGSEYDMALKAVIESPNICPSEECNMLRTVNEHISSVVGVYNCGENEPPAETPPTLVTTVPSSAVALLNNYFKVLTEDETKSYQAAMDEEAARIGPAVPATCKSALFCEFKMAKINADGNENGNSEYEYGDTTPDTDSGGGPGVL